MEKKEKVVAVTVTYNSAELLKKTIDALLKQSYEVDNIIVVDNASDEKNKKLIESYKGLSEIIHIIYLQENSGGAGGFEFGVSYARDNLEFDWIWLMDDDAYPRIDCLENLIKNKGLYKVGCLAPLIYGVDNNEYQLYHHKYVKRWHSKDKIVYSRYEDVPEISTIDADAFVGPLFSRKIVDELGVPDGSLFIYGDDQEYTYRISRKYNIYLIKNAVMNHKDINASMSGSPKAWWKDYYMHRNRMLFVKEFSENSFELFMGMTFVKLGIYKRLIMCLLDKKLTLVLKNKRKELLLKSLRDGSRGISGKRIDPGEYYSWLNKVKG